MKVEDKTARRAKIKLVLASVIALLFMIGEALGKGSSICISAECIWIGKKVRGKTREREGKRERERGGGGDRGMGRECRACLDMAGAVWLLSPPPRNFPLNITTFIINVSVVL